MADDELKSFKISDTQRPTVGRASSGINQEDDGSAEIQSLGFARIYGRVFMMNRQFSILKLCIVLWGRMPGKVHPL